MTSLAGASARPAYDVMLYGDSSSKPYGWASPGEVEKMLRSPWPGPGNCPPAPAGQDEDRCLLPSAGDYFFWEQWHMLRGLDEHWAGTGLPHPWITEPEITFYLGTHRPAWLWSGAADYPLCVSYGRLREVKRLHRGRVRWILDSRGFSELSQHGRWTIPAGRYIEDVARYDEEIGGLQWAAPQDWMCEPAIIHGGMLGNVRCAGTGLSVTEHQRRTVANFAELVSLWPRYSSRPCPVIPVLQGDGPEAYLRCYQMYLDAGILLGDEYPLAGVGSVCRLQSTRRIGAVARTLGQLNLELHWFGLKLTGIARPEIHRDLTSPYVYAGTQSMDSASWSLSARRDGRLPGCTHVSPRTGLPSRCNNCPRYAAAWRRKVLAAMAAAQESPARTQVQGALFTEAPAAPGGSAPALTWEAS